MIHNPYIFVTKWQNFTTKMMITINEIAKPQYTHKFKTNHTYKICHIFQLLGNMEDVTSNF
jgi:hypothetical protein